MLGRKLVFIVRAPADRALVAQVVRALSDRGLPSWNAPLANPASGLLDPSSMEAMQQSGKVLLFLSADAADSELVERELIVAQQLRRPILVASVEGAAPGRLEPLLADAIRIPVGSSAAEIADAVSGRTPPPLDTAEADAPLAVRTPTKIPWIPIVAVAIGVVLLALIALAVVLMLRRTAAPVANESVANAVVAVPTDTNIVDDEPAIEANVAEPAPEAIDPTLEGDRAVAERERLAREQRLRERAERERERAGQRPDLPPPPTPTPAPPIGETVRARQVRGGISSADYPSSALRSGQQGTVVMSIDIDADGRVTGCAVTRSSGSAALDGASCNLVRRRFRFTPALRDGRPVPETRPQRIDWRLPDN